VIASFRMAIKTLIVDDEPLAREKLRALLSQEPDVDVVGEAEDGEDALQAIRRTAPDLVLLDVQMPGLDGFGVLNSLGETFIPAVIFVTAHDEFALRAFEVHAVDYLLKPFDRERLQQALNHARTVIQSKRAGQTDRDLNGLLAELSRLRPSPERLAVKTEGRILLLRIEDIDWIETADNYVRLHVGKAGHLHRETLTALEARLPSRLFVRISRSVMVNVDRIRELQPLFHGDYAVTLRDGTQLTLSRSQRSKLDLLIAGQGG
jgi:two-component system, LytTR family, response regulator